MNRFLKELVKAALGVIALVGICLIAVGIVFLVYPEALRWGVLLLSILIGIYLLGCSLYGIIKVKTGLLQNVVSGEATH